MNVGQLLSQRTLTPKNALRVTQFSKVFDFVKFFLPTRASAELSRNAVGFMICIAQNVSDDQLMACRLDEPTC